MSELVRTATEAGKDSKLLLRSVSRLEMANEFLDEALSAGGRGKGTSRQQRGEHESHCQSCSFVSHMVFLSGRVLRTGTRETPPSEGSTHVRLEVSNSYRVQ